MVAVIYADLRAIHLAAGRREGTLGARSQVSLNGHGSRGLHRGEAMRCAIAALDAVERDAQGGDGLEVGRDPALGDGEVCEKGVGVHGTTAMPRE